MLKGTQHTEYAVYKDLIISTIVDVKGDAAHGICSL